MDPMGYCNKGYTYNKFWPSMLEPQMIQSARFSSKNHDESVVNEHIYKFVDI